ncbi:hypothetical protein AVEN_57744-1 [Araneus ventricosus]|uniref:DUF4219 domain-containing protein n=1 Tax=Araneus ventricosus TaxID=182803 RepID=A0A4Y2MA12_ARAVE|nr:hypothetical protein AVEN_57744-1 [Araneus ventricosus]
MNEATSVLDFPKSTVSSSFCEWKIDVQMFLRDRGLFSFVSGIEAPSDQDAEQKEVNDLNRRKKNAISTIYRALDSSIKRLITNAKDPSKAWKILHETEPSSKATLS